MLFQTDQRSNLPKCFILLTDIGPKFGFATMDNGMMLFDHVRVPYDSLLMKNNKVERDGTYATAGDKKASYAAMSHMRAAICRGSGRYELSV